MSKKTEAEAMFQRVQHSDLLHKPSLKECQIIVETAEISDKLALAIRPWGKIRSLLCGGIEEELPTHKATEETMVLLEKISEFWKFVEESLVLCPRKSLQ